MSQRSRRRNSREWIIALVALAIISSATASLAAAAAAAEPVGRVTSALGAASIQSERGPARSVGVLAPVSNQDKITTGPTGAATILLNSKVVFKLDSNTILRLVETKDRTEAYLERGTMEVFIGERPRLGNVTNPVVAVLPESETIGLGTVFYATCAPEARLGAYYCVDHSLKVKPKFGDETIVRAGQVARVESGRLRPLENFDRNQIRQQVKTLPGLRRQAARTGASLSQQRAAATSIRTTLVAEYLAAGVTRQRAETLSDLLVARCADIDHASDLAFNKIKGEKSQVPLADATAVNNILTVSVIDLVGLDGDVIRLQARSCTQADLVTLNDTRLQGDGFRLNIRLDKVPNIVRFGVTGIFEGRDPQATPSLVRVVNGKNQFPPLKTFFLNEGDTQYLDVRVTSSDAQAVKAGSLPAVSAKSTARSFSGQRPKR